MPRPMWDRSTPHIEGGCSQLQKSQYLRVEAPTRPYPMPRVLSRVEPASGIRSGQLPEARAVLGGYASSQQSNIGTRGSHSL